MDLIFLFKKLVSAMLLPPLNSLVLFALAWLLFKLHYRKLAQSAAAIAFVLLYALSTPWVANGLVKSLEQPAYPLADYRQAQAIVVLGGQSQLVALQEGELGNELFDGIYAQSALPLHRVRHAAFLHKQTGLPILVTGGSAEGKLAEAQLMAAELRDYYHVPVQWVEDRSVDTAENAQFSRDLLQNAENGKQVHTIVLVSNSWHLTRAKMLFEQQGFKVLTAPIGNPQHLSEGALGLIPRVSALENSTVALKEWLGIAWEWAWEWARE